mmetsp:Transcript_10537/g.24973  ORF Transcript_10537/g.24973 Transcript_10537/m.24973 type:complete len:243 (+) Transcript_10537:85-813(+)
MTSIFAICLGRKSTLQVSPFLEKLFPIHDLTHRHTNYQKRFHIRPPRQTTHDFIVHSEMNTLSIPQKFKVVLQSIPVLVDFGSFFNQCVGPLFIRSDFPVFHGPGGVVESQIESNVEFVLSVVLSRVVLKAYGILRIRLQIFQFKVALLGSRRYLVHRFTGVLIDNLYRQFVRVDVVVQNLKGSRERGKAIDIFGCHENVALFAAGIDAYGVRGIHDVKLGKGHKQQCEHHWQKDSWKTGHH